jgi:transposase-like protein
MLVAGCPAADRFAGISGHSFCDVEDLLAERGIAISYETVRRSIISGRSLQRNCGSAVPSRKRSGILTRSI